MIAISKNLNLTLIKRCGLDAGFLEVSHLNRNLMERLYAIVIKEKEAGILIKEEMEQDLHQKKKLVELKPSVDNKMQINVNMDWE